MIINANGVAIKVGDTVQVKGIPSPDMAVVGEQGPVRMCIWFVGSAGTEKCEMIQVHEDCLVKVATGQTGTTSIN
jgi:uncharacterized protein YodC (DUF2158 family)